MASFTDAISTFNPYIQELPIEAMVQVGMYKQQKYDEGVQKIQSYIDNIAGMDIIKDPQKKYLQSKLNELGSNLKKFAAADFSDNQLVNSVGGMASQLARDPIIQRGVYSTARIRKGMQQIEADKKSGAYNPNNEIVFNDEVNSYLNDGKLDSSFNGEYSTFFDYNKFVKEQFDAIKPGGYTFNQIFKTDSNGDPKLVQRRDEKGNPVGQPFYEYSDYMTTVEYEGNMPEVVKSTMSQILSDGRVRKQLSIDGRATYRGYTPEQLNKTLIDTKEEIIDNEYEDLLGLLLYKTSGTKQIQGKNIDELISAQKEKIENTTKSYDDMAKMALENPDAAKAKMFTDAFVSNATTRYGAMKTKTTISANPAADFQFKLTQEANKVQADKNKLAYDMYKDAQDRALKEKLNKNTVNASLLAASMRGKNAGTFTLVDNDGDGILDSFTEGPDGGFGGPGGGGGGLFAPPRQGQQPSDPETYDAAYESGKESAATNFKNAQSALIYDVVLKNLGNNAQTIEKLRSANPGLSQAELVNIMVDKVKRRAGESVEQARARLALQAMSTYGKMTKQQRDANPDFVDVVNSYSQAQRAWSAMSALDKSITKDVETKVGLEGASAASLKNIKPITGEYQGKKFTLTPSQQYDLALYMNGNLSGIGINYGGREQAGIQAGKRLSAAGLGFLLDQAERQSGHLALANGQLITGAIRGVQSLWAGAKDVLGAQDYATLDWEPILKLTSGLDNTLLEKAKEAKIKSIKQRFAVQPNLEMTIITGDAETDRGTVRNLNEIAATSVEYGQNLATRDDVKGFGKAVANPKFLEEGGSLQMRVINAETGNPQVEIVAGNAEEGRMGAIVLTRDEALQRGVNVDALYESPQTKAVRDMAGAYGGKTTPLNVKDVENYYTGNTWFSKNDMPALRSYPNDVKANFFQQNGKWYGQLYVKTPKGVISRTTTGNPNLQATVQRVQSLTGPMIDSLSNE